MCCHISPCSPILNWLKPKKILKGEKPKPQLQSIQHLACHTPSAPVGLPNQILSDPIRPCQIAQPNLPKVWLYLSQPSLVCSGQVAGSIEINLRSSQTPFFPSQPVEDTTLTPKKVLNCKRRQQTQLEPAQDLAAPHLSCPCLPCSNLPCPPKYTKHYWSLPNHLMKGKYTFQKMQQTYYSDIF